MPSFVMLPFIQCHQTLGRADCGGCSKPAFNPSCAGLACENASVLRHASDPNSTKSLKRVSGRPTRNENTPAPRLILFTPTVGNTFEKRSNSIPVLGYESIAILFLY